MLSSVRTPDPEDLDRIHTACLLALCYEFVHYFSEHILDFAHENMFHM